jgi:hypothetical protein
VAACARAQQREKMRHIGVLMNTGADDAEGQARFAAFLQGLQEAGWAVGRNVRIELRWGAGDAGHIGSKRRNWSRSHRTFSLPAASRPRHAGYVDRILKGVKPARPAGAGAGEIRAGD